MGAGGGGGGARIRGAGLFDLVQTGACRSSRGIFESKKAKGGGGDFFWARLKWGVGKASEGVGGDIKAKKGIFFGGQGNAGGGMLFAGLCEVRVVGKFVRVIAGGQGRGQRKNEVSGGSCREK